MPADNCNPSVTVTQSPAAGTVITTTTTITLTANDGNGNTTTCTFDVIPADNTPPTIICPSNFNVTFSASCQYTLLNFTPLATTFDNCAPIVTVTQSPAAGTIITSATVVTLTADDGNGNTSTCDFNVIPSDVTPPTITCPPDQNENFDVNCQFTLPDYTGLAITADNCATILTVTQSPVPGTVITGTTTITLTNDDGNGNTTTCTFDVIPSDITPPTITCPPNLNVGFDANCQYTLLDYTALATASDNCTAAVTVTQSPAPGTVITATTTLTLTADDGNGNTTACTFDINPVDNAPPTISCPADQNVSFDAACQYTLLDYTGMPSTSDNCAATVTVTQSPAAGTIITATTTITLTADDGNGNTSTCTFDVIPADNTPPSITCPPNQNVSFDANCQFIVLDYTATVITADNCSGTITVSQNPSPGSVITGTTTITLTADDGNGNTNDCTFDLLPADNTNPTVICQNHSAYLDISGNVTISTTDIDNGSSDACGIASMTLTNSNFTCAEVGANTVYLIVTDNSGNVDSCMATVTVLDTINPTMVCQNINAYLDVTGNITISPADIDNGTSDACGLASLNLSNTAYTCTNIGANTVYLIATDNNGNTDSCAATVTVLDTIVPDVICQDITTYLDATGNVSIIPSDIDNGSTDACGISTLSLSNSSFDCSTAGTNTIYLIATDVNGNVDSCAANVTVIDSILPAVVCQNITGYLDASGLLTISASDIDNGSSDICGIDTMLLSDSTFTCSDLGPNTIYLIVTDNNSNVDSCAATVLVLDTIAPTVVCQDLNVYLDAVGLASITISDIDNGTSDACGIDTIMLSTSDFACSEVGPNTIYLIAVDSSGNIDSCLSTVTVFDTVSPTPICQDVTAYLDATGAVTITASDVDNGSTDACGVATIVLSDSVFDCGDTGINTSYLIVTDVNGNIDSCAATITIIDTIPPTTICQDFTLMLDANGNGVVNSSDIDAGSSDPCGISTYEVLPDQFDCTDVGTNTVMLTVIDLNGNSSSCTAVVTVMDTVPPTVICQDTTIYLDNTGNATIPVTAIDDGTSDACGISNIYLSETAANCENVGLLPIYLIAVDAHGNIDSCQANVTIADTISPIISCEVDHVEYLDENCLFTIPNYIPTMTDNCTDGSALTFTQVPAAGTSIGGIGTIQEIFITVTDESGNSSYCAFNITLEDNLPPVFNCPEDQENTTDYSCIYIIDDYTYLLDDASDGCDFDSIIITQTPAPGSTVKAKKLPGDFTHGETTVTITIQDLSGNIDSCLFTLHMTCITELFIPQLLSPNNDGKNDVLIIDGLEIYPRNELVIFNRWGETVFEASPYNNDWEGEATKGLYGQEVPDGSYFYKLKLEPEGETLTGYIIIKR